MASREVKEWVLTTKGLLLLANERLADSSGSHENEKEEAEESESESESDEEASPSKSSAENCPEQPDSSRQTEQDTIVSRADKNRTKQEAGYSRPSKGTPPIVHPSPHGSRSTNLRDGRKGVGINDDLGPVGDRHDFSKRCDYSDAARSDVGIRTSDNSSPDSTVNVSCVEQECRRPSIGVSEDDACDSDEGPVNVEDYGSPRQLKRRVSQPRPSIAERRRKIDEAWLVD